MCRLVTNAKGKNHRYRIYVFSNEWLEFHGNVYKLKALSTKYLTCSSSVYICSYMQVYILSIMRYAYVDDDKDKMPEA